MTFTDLLWALILAQICMGALDMIAHHELGERLAWRPAQRRELRLHAMRNGIYTILFAGIAWTMPHGWWAAGAAVFFAVETVITMMDFVEEDRSRKLPATERVLHLALSMGFGGMLALLAPILFDWINQPTALHIVNHGVLSWILTAAAFGTAVFGAREWMAADRSDRLAPPPPETLGLGLQPNQTVLVTGATGFIGQRLLAALAAEGAHVIALVRDPARLPPVSGPMTVITSLDDIHPATSVDAIVNLAGEPIAAGLWTAERKRAILNSRIDMTKDVVRLIRRLDRRPGVLVNASAVGWYGLRDDTPLNEASEPAPCFSHALCAAWEAEALEAQALGVRTVLLRIGIVLGTEGGVLSRMLVPFEFGLGGPIGDGKQWLSWITRDDLVRLIGFAIANVRLAGPVNGTAPSPVTNQAFMRALARSLNRPAWTRAPAAALRRIGGEMAEELLLGGQRVLPDVATAAGFRFNDPDLQPALDRLTGSKRAGAAAAEQNAIAQNPLAHAPPQR